MSYRAPGSAALLALALAAGGCTSLGDGPPTVDFGSGDAAADGGAADPNAPWDDPPAALPAGQATFRTSLGQCWTDASCPRVMLVSHGGDWDATRPYDSRGALVRAVQNGADGIKADLRITADQVAVIAHSSPIELWESVDCQGKKIEEMTAAEVTHCHMLGTDWTFQRVDRLLQWARGRTVVMLDVKRAVDLPAAIQTGIANAAGDDLYFEVHAHDFETIVVGAPGWEQLHYLVWLDSPADIDRLIAEGHARQGFMYEMDPTYPGYDAAAMQKLISGKLHPAGLRAFTSTDTQMPTAANHQALFDEGFDVVMTYDLAAGLPVRQGVNRQRGVTPP